MKFVFGPVPSRRLGQSLGIDPVPLKTCNWNCVYCQLGRSTPLINVREQFFSSEEILAEVVQALESHKTGEIDWITFIGSGETTLHSGIGWMIRQVKSLTEIPVAVVTNGSLLYLPDIRDELTAADAVLPSLDAGDEKTYRKINRPHPDISYPRLVKGLTAFRNVYKGKLWIEVMLVRGLNDTENALIDILRALEKIHPDEIHILQPTRPPCEAWVEPPTVEGLMLAQAILGKSAQVIHPARGSFDLTGSQSQAEAVIGIITRHPMTEDELIQTLAHYSPEQVASILMELEKSGQAQIVERFGTRFWSAAPAKYR